MNRRRRPFSRSWLLLVLLGSMVVGPGCATMQVGARVPPRISARNVEYDGLSLRFLLVVQSMADGTTLDRRLGETSVGLVGPPVACDSDSPLALIVQGAPPATVSQELVQVREGESFAREVEIFLFDTAGPECIRAQIDLTNPRAEAPITIVGRVRPATP
jgi:hypothetical protein